MTDMAKIFWSGRKSGRPSSQGISARGQVGHISRDGRKLILEPVEEDGWAWLDRLEPLDHDAVAAALERPGPEEADLLYHMAVIRNTGLQLVGILRSMPVHTGGKIHELDIAHLPELIAGFYYMR